MEREADVVVIGGGLSGTSIASHLARAGKKVVLLACVLTVDGVSNVWSCRTLASPGCRVETAAGPEGR